MCGASLHDNCGLPLLGDSSTGPPRPVIWPRCVCLPRRTRDKPRADDGQPLMARRFTAHYLSVGSAPPTRFLLHRVAALALSAAESAAESRRDDLPGAVLGPLPAGASSGEVRWYGACGHHEIVRPPDCRPRATFCVRPAPCADGCCRSLVAVSGRSTSTETPTRSTAGWTR